MAGGARWISAGQISPGTARAQDVQHTMEHWPRIRPGTPTSIGTWRRGSKIGFQRGPLGVGQITSRNSHYSFDAAALFVGRALIVWKLLPVYNPIRHNRDAFSLGRRLAEYLVCIQEKETCE